MGQARRLQSREGVWLEKSLTTFTLCQIYQADLRAQMRSPFGIWQQSWGAKWHVAYDNSVQNVAAFYLRR